MMDLGDRKQNNQILIKTSVATLSFSLKTTFQVECHTNIFEKRQMKPFRSL